LLQAIANMSDVPFEGIKIQLKGRMSGKGGKASKKVWVWGRTGRKAVDDPLDYAHEAVVTRAGYIGIKVSWPVVAAVRSCGGWGCSKAAPQG
jgi:ribosomal protein S3